MNQKLYTAILLLVTFVAQAKLFNGYYIDTAGHKHYGIIRVRFFRDCLAPWNQSKMQFTGGDGIKIKLNTRNVQEIVAEEYHFQPVRSVRKHGKPLSIKRPKFLLVTDVSGTFKLYHWIYYYSSGGFGISSVIRYYIVTPEGKTEIIEPMNWRPKLRDILSQCALADGIPLDDYRSIPSIIKWANKQKCNTPEPE